MSETKSEERVTLASALVAAQAEMPAVPPDATNPHFQSQFVTLGNLIRHVRPVLNKHGIAVVQMPSENDGHPTLITRLIHENGESIESTMPLLLTKKDPQGLGSSLTYARRYALASALGISDQDDDDGNAGTQAESSTGTGSGNTAFRNRGTGFAPPKPGKMSQRDFFAKLLKEAGATPETADLICSWASTEYDGVSESIEKLKSKDKAKAEGKSLKAQAESWQAKQSDTPADTEGLPAAA